jgi:DNA ligase-1
MDYSRLAAVYSELERTSSKLDKVGIIAAVLRECRGEDLYRVTMLLQGRVFPPWSEREIGIATQLMIKTISNSTGFGEKEIEREFRDSGDLGLVAEKLVSKKRQSTLFNRKLTIGMVFENLQKLADTEGRGSQQRKFQLVSEMMGSADPVEAKYIVRTVLGDLRIGVAEGIVRDSITKAYFGKLEGSEYKEAGKAVEWAWFLRPDYGEVAKIASESGLDGLRKVRLEVGKPYMVQLSEKSPGIEEALGSYEEPALEYKYDGARICIHKKGEKVWFYTRRLENITEQFPEVREMAVKAVKAKSCIIEGEMIGIDKKSGRPLPFQFLSQRIRRKYGIERIMREIPVKVRLFDMVYLVDKVMFAKAQKERWEGLKNVISPIGDSFKLAEHIETRDIGEAEAFYKKALSSGHEGLIIKDTRALYQPGRRVAGGWLKVKPTMENLDLVVIGATWGTGKRAGWLGSLVLGCRDENGEFRECGMIGTGIKEKAAQKGARREGVTFDMLMELLRPNIESEKGNSVRIRPRVVIEVAYEEIQKSPNYSSGYALRFPRLVSIRDDRKPEDSDDIQRIERLFLEQKR